MPFFLPRPSKVFAVAVFALSMIAQANAADTHAAEEQELYAYLFPEATASQAPATVGEGAPRPATAVQRVRSAWDADRPNAWSADQRQAMLEAFKAKPATAAEPVPTPFPVGSGSFVQSPVAMDGQPYAELIKTYAKKRNLSPLLVQQIIKAESGFDAGAVSPKGASGLMQLMPATAAQFNVDPFDPEMNINAGTQYFAQLLAKYDRVDYALAAYNAGPGAVDKYGGIPPFPETQNYVSSILAAVAQLEASNG